MVLLYSRGLMARTLILRFGMTANLMNLTVFAQDYKVVGRGKMPNVTNLNHFHVKKVSIALFCFVEKRKHR